jgi:putative membrane protein
MTWKMIPFVSLIAWLLIGIEEIALQIEQPFGFDASDLPLDLMCAELRNEVEQIIARLKEAPEDATPLF